MNNINDGKCSWTEDRRGAQPGREPDAGQLKQFVVLGAGHQYFG